eukprot:Gb_14035 [translate_table: standard]
MDKKRNEGAMVVKKPCVGDIDDNDHLSSIILESEATRYAAPQKSVQRSRGSPNLSACFAIVTNQKLGPMAIDTRVYDLRVPTLGTMAIWTYDEGCVNFGELLSVTGHYGSRGCFIVSLDTQLLLEEQFHFLTRGVKAFSGMLEQCQARPMLQNAGVLDGRGNIDADINGHWNFNNKTVINAAMIKSWSLVNYSPRLCPTKVLHGRHFHTKFKQQYRLSIVFRSYREQDMHAGLQMNKTAENIENALSNNREGLKTEGHSRNASVSSVASSTDYGQTSTGGDANISEVNTAVSDSSPYSRGVFGELASSSLASRSQRSDTEPDIGGFAGDATPKLFAQWVGISTRHPFSHGHSKTGTSDHEPWAFGDDCENMDKEKQKELFWRMMVMAMNTGGDSSEAELSSAVVFVKVLGTEGLWKRPKHKLNVQLLLGEGAKLETWGMNGEEVRIEIPPTAETAKLVAESQKQCILKIAHAKRIPKEQEHHAVKGTELSKTPVDLKDGEWHLKVVPWEGGLREQVRQLKINAGIELGLVSQNTEVPNYWERNSFGVTLLADGTNDTGNRVYKEGIFEPVFLCMEVGSLEEMVESPFCKQAQRHRDIAQRRFVYTQVTVSNYRRLLSLFVLLCSTSLVTMVNNAGPPSPAGHLRDIFYRMGLTDKEIVALSGAHTLGRSRPERSGWGKPGTKYTITKHTQSRMLMMKTMAKCAVVKDGPGAPGGQSWTVEWLKFDNSYFKEIKERRDEDLLVLPTDAVLFEDPGFKEYAEKYAVDQNAFFEDYAEAHAKLSNLGAKFDPPDGFSIADSPKEQAPEKFVAAKYSSGESEKSELSEAMKKKIRAEYLAFGGSPNKPLQSNYFLNIIIFVAVLAILAALFGN